MALLVLVFLATPGTTEAQPGCSNTQEPIRSACLAAAKNGVKAVSCYRSADDQARLRRYFYSIGRRGQVAKGRSLHQLGRACDFSRNLGQQYRGLRRLNSRAHKGNHYSDTGH